MSSRANIVIYSKDRAMQLKALLDSLNRFLVNQSDKQNITVIYKASNAEYQKGYERLSVLCGQEYPKCKLVSEIDFRNDTMAAIDASNQYTMFLVDDIMFYRPWSFDDKPFQLLNQFPEGVLAVSLRLGSNTSYCYPLSRQQTIPSFYKECAWKWIEADGDFAYPMSLDGNVFLTKKIIEILSYIANDKFIHPNVLEGSLNDFAQARKHVGTLAQIMTCYPESSRLINNPCNRVQDLVQNKTESSYDAEKLNKMFIDGNCIDVESTTDLIRDSNQVNAAHYPTEIIIHGYRS